MRSTPVVVVLTLALAASLPGQEPPRKSTFFYAGGGLDAAYLLRYPPWLGYGRNAGLSLQTGYAWQFSRLGLRLGVAYYDRHREYNFTNYPPGYTGPTTLWSSRSSTVGASLDLTYDLTRARVRPYLIGGLGLYRSSTTYSDTTRPKSHVTELGGALFYGAGLRLPIGKAEAFLEARFHHLGGGSSGVLLPLTFGLRF